MDTNKPAQSEGNEPSTTSPEADQIPPNSDINQEDGASLSLYSHVQHQEPPIPENEGAKHYEEMYTKAKEDLQLKQQELDEQKERFKNLVKELNRVKVKSQSHLVHQVMDKDIEEEVGQLRFRIRNFTFQYFDEDLRTMSSTVKSQLKPKYQDLVGKYPGIGWDSFVCLVQSRSLDRPSVMQALIWDTLDSRLFGKFLWANHDVHEAMRSIKRFLDPRTKPASSRDREETPESLRRYNMWRANTSIVILEASGGRSGDKQADVEAQFCRDIAHDLDDFLRPFSGRDKKGLFAETIEIVQEAINLNKTLHKQVAELTWVPRPGRISGSSFDPKLMQFEETSEPKTAEFLEDLLVVAPGLEKRGKSTGEDFDLVTVLCKANMVNTPRVAVAGPKESQRPGRRGSR